MKRFTQINVEDYELSRVQDAIANALNPIADVMILDGILINNISVNTSDVQIVHKLGRKPRAWFVCGKDASGDVWQTSSDDKILTLRASTSMHINLWVV